MPGSHLRFVRMRFKIKISQVHVPPVIFNLQGLERRTTPVLHRGGRHLTLLLGVVEESQDPAPPCLTLHQRARHQPLSSTSPFALCSDREERGWYSPIVDMCS
jgi:hypothetical protein